VSKLTFALYFVFDATYWGGVFGVVLGILTPLVVVGFNAMGLLFVPIGAAWGLASGIALGIANGVLAVLVTLAFFYPLKDGDFYRRAMKFISGGFTFVLALIIYYMLFDVFANAPLLWVIGVAGLTTVGAIFTSSRFSNRYLKSWRETKEKETPSVASL
jgi:hypothetical protein